MHLSVISILLLMALSAAPQIPRAASGNECATCHLRLASTQSTTTHVDQWVTSKHAFHRVGCEKCHGGDATTPDQAAAHRGVLAGADRSSAVHRMALPAMCGSCHTPAANAFATSVHSELLSQGDAMAPTCTSCHSSMATEVPSPAAMEYRCLRCHHDDPQDRAHTARRQLDDLRRLRAALRRANLEIAAIADAERRMVLSTRWNNADLSLRGVVAGIHAFDERRVEDRLSDARAQVDRLRAELANPK